MNIYPLLVETLFRLLVMVLLDLDKWEGFDGSQYLSIEFSGRAGHFVYEAIVKTKGTLMSSMQIEIIQA